MSIVDEGTALRTDETTGHKGAGRPGVPADPFRIRRALWRGKWLLIGAGVFGVTFGLLWVKLMMSSHYETTAVLKYEGDVRVAGLPPSNNALGPVADALRQQSVLRKIADETGFEGSLMMLGSAIGYQVNLMSNTLQITVAGETGEDAAAFANIVTEVFMSYHKDRQARRIENEIGSIGKRIDAAEDQAEAARSRYNDFREQHGIADLSTEQRSMVESAAKLRADSELATSEIRALEAQIRSLETQLANTPKSVVSTGASPEPSPSPPAWVAWEARSRWRSP